MMVSVLVLALLTAQPSPPPRSESLVQKLLRIAGLTAAPSQMRSPGDTEPGNVWIADLDRGGVRALTQEGNYRSPVFAPAAAYVYALKDDTIVRIALATGQETLGKRVPTALKLVGFDGQRADDLVLLIESEGDASPLVSVSLKTGSLTPLPHDPKSADERRLLAMVRAGDRAYGDTRVYTRTESRAGLARKVEWTDVYLARGAAAPVNISACDGVNCAEPALSSDGRRIAFIKSGA